MSTTTVSMHSTSDDVRLAELREQEAIERQRRRDEERQRAAEAREAAQRDAALASIEAIENIHRNSVARLDAAAARLPDLALKAPRLPTPPPGADAAHLQAHAAQLRAQIQEFVLQVDREIRHAEYLLKRREDTAKAWRDVGDLEQRLAMENRTARELSLRVPDAVFSTVPTLQRPGEKSELEDVLAHVASLNAVVDTAQRQRMLIEARAASHEKGRALAGAAVSARNAAEVHATHVAGRVAAAQARMRTHIEKSLAAQGMRREELGNALRELVDTTIALVGIDEVSIDGLTESVDTWIARARHRREAVATAQSRLCAVPEFVQENAVLAARWKTLAARLQRVACGFEDYSNNIEAEYRQLESDAKCAVRQTFTRADWINKMRAGGFEVFDCDTPDAMVVVNPDDYDIWYEAHAHQDNEGNFAVVLEVLTDVPPSPAFDEDRKTASVCKQLADITGNTSGIANRVKTESEVIEQKSRITRRHRPKEAQRAMQLPLA